MVRFLAKAGEGDLWTSDREKAARSRAGFMQGLKVLMAASTAAKKAIEKVCGGCLSVYLCACVCRFVCGRRGARVWRWTGDGGWEDEVGPWVQGACVCSCAVRPWRRVCSRMVCVGDVMGETTGGCRWGGGGREYLRCLRVRPCKVSVDALAIPQQGRFSSSCVP